MTKGVTHTFPWSGSHPWDVDILVIGAGPAVLSATTRLRWMKTFNPIPLSVVLANSGPIGGLAKLGNSILTGPSLAFPAGELVSRLQEDLEAYPTPILHQKALSVVKDNDLFTTTLEDGSSITSVAVIMACGMLDLRNIAEFWRKGVTATFGNRKNILKILSRELGNNKKPVILGGPHLIQLAKTIHNLCPDVTLLINGQPQETKASVVFGDLHHIDQTAHGMQLTIMSEGKEINIETDSLIIEFNSLELHRPPLPSGIKQNQQGYIQQEEQIGFFHAGDCNGPPFSAVVALGEGEKAGLEAYQYTHEYKYKKTAPLFAYYGDESVVDDHSHHDDYMLDDGLIPVRLIDTCPVPTCIELWSQINGSTNLKELQATTSMGKALVYEQITTLLEKRALTFCPQRDQT